MVSCRDYRSGSSVPNTAVQLELNTDQFPTYNPNNATAWFTVDKRGYCDEGGKLFKPRTMTDYYGYQGVLVIIGWNANLYAFDLACPNCLNAIVPNSYFSATCPHCGEEYQTDYGTGIPTKGITQEGLKRYSVFYSNHTIRIYN